MDAVYFISACGQVVVTIAGGMAVYHLKKQDQERARTRQRKDEESRAIRDGLCALLRDRLMQSCLHFEKLRYIPPRELECVSRMYNAYHGLGGNDIITSLYAEMVELPHSEEAVEK